jgi:hypothetical protein
MWRYGGENRGIQGFGREPEGKKPLVRRRHRCEYNIKIDLKEIDQGLE